MQPNRLTIKNNTSWPNPSSDLFADICWKLRHNKDGLSQSDLYIAASVMEAYDTLINHTAFTLKHVNKVVSGIRKAIKENE
jgi:biotin-(acetyl-CoA carboxylase) ligase